MSFYLSLTARPTEMPQPAEPMGHHPSRGAVARLRTRALTPAKGLGLPREGSGSIPTRPVNMVQACPVLASSLLLSAR